MKISLAGRECLVECQPSYIVMDATSEQVAQPTKLSSPVVFLPSIWTRLIHDTVLPSLKRGNRRRHVRRCPMCNPRALRSAVNGPECHRRQRARVRRGAARARRR